MNPASPISLVSDCAHVHSGDEDTLRYICLVCPQGRSPYPIHRLISADGKLPHGNDATVMRTPAVSPCPCSIVRTTRRRLSSSRMQRSTGRFSASADTSISAAQTSRVVWCVYLSFRFQSCTDGKGVFFVGKPTVHPMGRGVQHDVPPLLSTS